MNKILATLQALWATRVRPFLLVCLALIITFCQCVLKPAGWLLLNGYIYAVLATHTFVLPMTLVLASYKDTSQLAHPNPAILLVGLIALRNFLKNDVSE